MEQVGGGRKGFNSLTAGVIGTSQDVRKDGVEYVVKKLCQHVRKGLTGEEWSKYESQKTDPTRIQLFLRKKEIQSSVQQYLKLHPGRKDKEKAILLKNAGNKAFGLGDNEKALVLYTQCLAWMPHDGTKDIALVYANRSAALFHLEEFRLAKRDAELAFRLNYPVELHYKLFERVGRCCAQLGSGDEASKNFQGAIKALEVSGMEDQKMKKTKRMLEDLVKNPPPNTTLGFHQGGGGKSGGNQESLFPIPDIVGGRNKYLRAASSRLTLQYREKQGRFVIANEGFRPGDVILVEPAYVSILNPEQYHRQCFQCYAPLRAPIVCESCIFASFCSTECQEKARKHHQYECSILGLLKNTGISVICYMAVRILTQTNPETVLGWYDLAEKTELDEISQGLQEKVSMESTSNSGCSVRDKMGTLESFGFNEEYRTDNHVALFHLVTHSQRRRPEDFLHQIVMALFLLEALKTTTYFNQFKTAFAGNDIKQDRVGGGHSGAEASATPSGDTTSCEKGLWEKNGNANKSRDEPRQTSISQNEPPSTCQEDIPLDVEAKFAVLLLRCLKCLQFNTHETAAWDEESEKDNSVGLGGGLFPTLALFNHSCNPAIVRYFVNDKVVVRAVRTIYPGEVVTENYGPNYSGTILEDRQNLLTEHYLFQCECIACKQDWPTFDKLTNENMKFRCGNCRTYICDMNADKMGILFKCGKCGHSVNILKALKSLHESEAKYNQAVKFINNEQMETGLGMLLENLYLLETYLMPPFREYHMCQEHMRRCYLAMGNRTSKLLPTWDPETVKVDE